MLRRIRTMEARVETVRCRFCAKRGKTMQLKPIACDFTVCKLASAADADLNQEFCFLGKTDEEISLVCRTEDTPEHTLERDDGWRAFRIQGVLDFSLIGILSRITGILAEEGIGIFAVSTFNTDYVLVRKDRFAHALQVLEKAGYEIL